MQRYNKIIQKQIRYVSVPAVPLPFHHHHLIIIIIIIIIILIISFMQGIYTRITETNYVPREYSVAAVLLLLFMVLISSVPVLNLLYRVVQKESMFLNLPAISFFGVTSNQKSTFENLV